jgi:hypothetical protein
LHHHRDGNRQHRAVEGAIADVAFDHTFDRHSIPLDRR